MMSSAENSVLQDIRKRLGWATLIGVMLVLMMSVLGAGHETIAAAQCCLLTATDNGESATGKTTSPEQEPAEKPQEVVRPRHILVYAYVVVMKQQDMQRLGTWRKVSLCDSPLAHPSQSGGASEHKSRTGIQMLLAPDPQSTDALWATLNSLEKDGQVQFLLRAPGISEDGHGSMLSFSAGGWYLSKMPYNGLLIDGSEIKRKPGPTILIPSWKVDGNDITAVTAVEISNRAARRCIYPLTVLRRTEEHTVTLQSGGTMAWVGAASYGQERERPSGLAGLPLLSGLFPSIKQDTTSEQTVIFITVLLLPESQRIQQPAQQ